MHFKNKVLGIWKAVGAKVFVREVSLGLSKLKGVWAKLLLGWWWKSGTGSAVPGDYLYCPTAEEHLLHEVTVWILVRKPALDKNNLFI